MNETRNVAPIRDDFTHGYTRYSKGCRCEVCRRAKADYMAARRAKAREEAAANPTRTVYTPSHGTRYAYEELGCRCRKCVTSEVQAHRLRSWRAVSSA